MSRLSEQEDLVQQRSRELAKLKVQIQCLEDENSELRLQLDNFGTQKVCQHCLDGYTFTMVARQNYVG
jgi:regulator of replication initiation timing